MKVRINKKFINKLKIIEIIINHYNERKAKIN